MTKMAQHFQSAAEPGADRSSTRSKTTDDFGSPSRLILAGVAGVVALTVFFFFATYSAVVMLNTKGIDAERQRAAVAIEAMAERGLAVDSTTVAKLGRDYVLSNTRLAAPGVLQPGEISVPITGSQMELAWTPRHMGDEIVAAVAVYRISSAGLVLGGLMLVLHRLYRLARDLEARRKAARQLADRDHLTGLANRRGFEDHLETAFGVGGDFALLYLDLDDFKLVNDSLGHAAGDKLLECVGQRLQRVVGEADLVARLGGDEFAILCRSRSKRGELSDFARLIHSRITAPYELAHADVSVGLSIGVALHGEHRGSAEDLVASADAALYRAKARQDTHFLFAAPAELEPAPVRPMTKAA
jgi:diguanylate cyclase (GGDEF)-like protein